MIGLLFAVSALSYSSRLTILQIACSVRQYMDFAKAFFTFQISYSFTSLHLCPQEKCGLPPPFSQNSHLHNSIMCRYLNPLKPELNPICYLLAILGAHHFFHVSRIRVKLLTFRLLMSYIYIYMEHPFLMFLDHTQ